jgi:ATP-dependent helicase/nuclease subunit B
MICHDDKAMPLNTPDSDLCRNIFNVPAGCDFLPELVRALLEGRLVPSWRYERDDPLALHDVTLFLPTRRAVRRLREVFAEELGINAVLPRIEPLGSFEPEDSFLASGDDNVLPRKTIVSPLSRKLVLSDFLLRAAGLFKGRAHNPFPIAPTMQQAWGLAGSLADLFEQMMRDEVSFEALRALQSDDHAEYWQVMDHVLSVVGTFWPNYLAEQGAQDPSQAHYAMMSQRANSLTFKGPVIIAGSTGSIPATLHLMRKVASHPLGALVLPGLDTLSPDALWEAIDLDDPHSLSHPQYGLKTLLQHLRCERAMVRNLSEPQDGLALRSGLIHEAMAPVEATALWPARQTRDATALKESFKSLSLIEAAHEDEEAFLIALVLRDAVQRGQESVAMVTPDRALARQVMAHAAHLGLALDDSAGSRLSDEPAGVFLGLLLQAVTEEFDPALWLSVCKHPLAGFGLGPVRCHRAARFLDRHAFRGWAHAPSLTALLDRLAEKAPKGDDFEEACQLLHHCFELIALAREAPVNRPLKDWAQLWAKLFDKAHAMGSQDENDSEQGQRTHEDREALAQLLQTLSEEDPALLCVSFQESVRFMLDLMREVPVRRPVYARKPAMIWGPLEARLQKADTLVLAGCNEGTWPGTTHVDPLLSRPMKKEVGLTLPERQIGLAAHDFTQMLACDDVVITRSLQMNGSPALPSRWLLRLKAVLPETVYDGLFKRGQIWHEVAKAYQVSFPATKAADRPSPRPPLDLRPRHFAITDIARLARDPYALYAKYVLRLKPLDPLEVETSAALKGSLFHEALSHLFTKAQAHPQKTFELDQAIISAVFEKADLPEATRQLWQARFMHMARALEEWEREREKHIQQRFIEIKGQWDFHLDGWDYRLHGRADRLDLLRNGAIAVMDFKTGSAPSLKAMKAIFEPQLLLEAHMVQEGAFAGVPQGSTVAEGFYVIISGNQEPFEVKTRFPEINRNKVVTSTPDMIEQTIDRFYKLLRRYHIPDQGYLSHAYPQYSGRFGGDYDCLARVHEWGRAEAEEEAL